MSVIPMPSTKISPGRYEVIGTSRGVEVVRHRGWWQLLADGEHVANFPTKRQALAYCQEHPEL